MIAGWIKIRRDIANHWLWQDAERLKWWLDLLFLAAWEDKRQLVGKQLIHLRRGQLIASLSFLCKRWGRSRTMIDPWLDLLVYDGMIVKSVSHNVSIITICNYELYQDNTTKDTYLETYLKADESVNYNDSDTQGYANLCTHPDAYLDATSKEYKNISTTTTIYNSDSKNLEFIGKMRDSPIWQEKVAMRFHIPVEEVIKRLDDFALDLEVRGTEHRDYNDARRHYCDWLRIQLEAEKKKNVEQQKNDSYGTNKKRRPNKAVAQSPEEFSDRF